MKKNLLFIFVVMLGVSGFAQICDPADYDWGSATFGVSPDPNEGESFEVGEVGMAYYDVIYVKCPAFAGDVLGPEHPMYALAATLPLDSVRLNSITLNNGLGDLSLSSIGLELTCNNNGDSPNPCMFYPSQSYCGDIAGTPTASGTWDVTINITVYFTFGSPQAIDYPLEGYTFTVDGGVGLNESTTVAFSVDQNSPNPANNQTTFNFNLANAEQVQLMMTNLIGERVISKKINGKKGNNAYVLDTSNIPNGIYLYSVESGNKKVTKRMVVQH